MTKWCAYAHLPRNEQVLLDVVQEDGCVAIGRSELRSSDCDPAVVEHASTHRQPSYRTSRPPVVVTQVQAREVRQAVKRQLRTTIAKCRLRCRGEMHAYMWRGERAQQLSFNMPVKCCGVQAADQACARITRRATAPVRMTEDLAKPFGHLNMVQRKQRHVLSSGPNLQNTAPRRFCPPVQYTRSVVRGLHPAKSPLG
eukprot:5882275-Pyramimonas_sp.AAC.1